VTGRLALHGFGACELCAECVGTTADQNTDEVSARVESLEVKNGLLGVL